MGRKSVSQWIKLRDSSLPAEVPRLSTCKVARFPISLDRVTAFFVNTDRQECLSYSERHFMKRIFIFVLALASVSLANAQTSKQ
jgi:hypothetical protein